jgi:hypothetical protein
MGAGNSLVRACLIYAGSDVFFSIEKSGVETLSVAQSTSREPQLVLQATQAHPA